MNNPTKTTGEGSPILAAAVAPVVESLEWGPSLAHTARCAADHFSPWMIEERWFRAAVEAVKAGTLRPRMMEDGEDGDYPKEEPYRVIDGTAVITIAGPMMKKRGKYAQTSSVAVRQAIRKAIHDEQVDSILLHIDCPGGSAAGTGDLAADVKAADAVKPVYAHIDDLGASAAYWVASQARRITANPTGEVGSIGTVMRLEDTSGFYAAKGVKVHVISTGKYKGAGYDGAPVTAEHLAMFQEEVDDLNEHFIQGVAKGRKGRMSLSDVRNAADGRVHIAAKAKAMGLIDDVATLDQAFAAMRKDVRQAKAADVTAPEPVAATTETEQPTPEPAPDQTQQTRAPEDSPTLVEPPPAVSTKESQMANEPTTQQAAPAPNPAAGISVSQGQSPQDQVARLNDQAIQNFIEKGKVVGRAEGRQALMDDFRAIVAVCPGRPQTAVNAFLAGQNASTVKLIVDAEIAAEANANRKAQEQEVEIARLRAEQARLMELNSIGGHPGVSARVFAPAAQANAPAPTGLEPEVQAEMEWESDPLLRAKNNNNKKTWMLFRVNQLKGNVGILARATA